MDKIYDQVIEFLQKPKHKLIWCFLPFNTHISWKKSKICKSVFRHAYYYYDNSLSGATFYANYVKFSRLLTFVACSLLGVLPYNVQGVVVV